VRQVVDLGTGTPKPRCRNCLYLTRQVPCVVTDELVWDGDMTKEKRTPRAFLANGNGVAVAAGKPNGGGGPRRRNHKQRRN